MRAFAALALLAALILAAVFLFGGSPATPGLADAPGGAGAAVPRALDAQLDGAESGIAEPAAAGAQRNVAVVEPALGAKTDSPLPRVLLRGRVVDSGGRPLEGAELVFSSSGTWREGEPEPTEAQPTSDSGRVLGFRFTTGADGCFEFDAPVPAADRVGLTVDAGPLHMGYRTRFDGSEGSRAPLVEGGHDLGDLRIADAGALAGRVVDGEGAPLVGVELRPEPLTQANSSAQAESDEQGRFALGPLPPGTCAARGWLDGYRDAESESREVRLGQLTDGLEIVLQPAETLRGTVVSTRGGPIEGAKVGAWATAGGSSSWATSREDGSFEIFLREPGTHRMEAMAEGFQPAGKAFGNGPELGPGATEVLIELKPAATTTFVVLDDATSEPLDEFGLAIYTGSGSGARDNLGYNRRQRPTPVPQADGRAEHTATPAIDAFQVFAEGFVPELGDVAWDEGQRGVQTVRLMRGGSIVGRLGGVEPASDLALARLQVVPGMMIEPGAGTQIRFSASGHELSRSLSAPEEARPPSRPSSARRPSQSLLMRRAAFESTG